MLGDKLVALRKKDGHSQQELADRLQVTRHGPVIIGLN